MRKIYLVFAFLCIQNACVHAQNEDERFVNWNDEQYSTYEDSIYKALYAPVVAYKEKTPASIVNKSLRKSRSKMPVNIVELSNVPNTKSIDTSKGVGEIPIKSGISQTGARTYEVPINVCKGMNGHQPTLSLSYNSQQGNSVMGMGWNIGGLSKIVRTARSIHYDGKTQGPSMNMQDAFVLDGIRLIKTNTISNYQLYESEQGNIKAKGYWTDNDVKYFEVFYPNGAKGVYGFQSNSQKVVSYPLTSLTDYNGNVISYSYNLSNNHYVISKISYNNSSVEFKYKTSRQDPITMYCGGIKIYENSLLDEITIRLGGNTICTYSFSYSVVNSHSFLTKINYSSGNSSYNPLEFYYGQGPVSTTFEKDTTQLMEWYNSSDPNMIKVIKGKFDYFNGQDGLIVLPNKNPYWKHYRHSTMFRHSQNRFDNNYKGDEKIFLYTTLDEGWSLPMPNLLTEKGFIDILCADIEGKQQEDVIKINNIVENNNDKVTFSVYRTHFAGMGKLYTRTYDFPTVYKDADGARSIQPKYYYTGDFNGDGKIEVIAMSVHRPFGDTTKPSKCYVFDLQNNKVLFQSHVLDFNVDFVGTRQSDATAAANNTDKLVMLDYDGDGKTDLCHINEKGTTIYTFDINGPTWSVRKIATYSSLTKANLANRELLTGEFNGDGLMDLLVSPDNSTNGGSTWNVYYSMGNGSFDKVSVGGTYNTKGNSNFLTQDINNDGITDVIKYNTNGFYTYLSNDKVFGGNTIYTSFSNPSSVIVPTNLNSNNSFTQLISLKEGKAVKHHFSRDDNKSSKLTGVINSLGQIEKTYYHSLDDKAVYYRTGTSVFQHGYGAIFPYVNIEEPLLVAASSETYLNNELLDYNAYSYVNAVVHKQGLGFRGFEQIRTVNSRHQLFTQTYAPYNYCVLVGEETPTSKNIYGYSTSMLPNKTTKIRLMHKEENNKLTGINCSTDYTYDEYGYPLSETVKYSDNITVKTECAYNASTDLKELYMLGVLKDKTTTTTSNGTSLVDRTFVPVWGNNRPIVKVHLINNKHAKQDNFAYDNCGNITSVSTSLYSDNNVQKTLYAYDSYGRIIQTTSPLGLVTKHSYDALGRVLSTTDSRGGITKFTYDEFGREIGVVYPDNTTKTTSYSWYIDGNSKYAITVSGTTLPTTVTICDAFGRDVWNQVKQFNNTIVSTRKVYDKYGNLTKQSLPYTGNTPSLWNNYSYDNYDRLVSVTEASGRMTSYQYSQNSVTTEEDNIARTKTYNSLGQLVTVTDPAGTISYSLHADGQPMEIVAPGNVVTTFAYDDYRRRISLTDPSLGTSEYEYDTRGNLIKDTNANGQSTINEYDPYNRLVKKNTPEFTTSYTYNSRNELINVISDNGTSSSYTYDNYGRIVSSRENVQDGKWLQKDLVYSAGKPSSIKYTSQTGVLVKENFEYANSYLVNVKLDDGTLVYKLTKENSFGKPTEVITGGVTRKYGYDNFGMPTYFQASNVTGSIQNISLSFDKDTRNLLSRKDATRNLEETFSYDNLNRLNGYGEEIVEYDNKGNITKKSDIGTYNYSLASKPYAVTGLSVNSTVSTSSQDVTYNSFFRPSSISEDGYLAKFFYKSEYDRTKMSLSKNGLLQSTKYYIAGNYELEETTSGTVERMYLNGDYYSSPVVYIKNNGQAGVLYNIIRDHLGSITHITTINGEVIQELSYDAWGRLRKPNIYALYEKGKEPSLFLGRGFTGHEHLIQFSLINMNARLYDSELGRFLSPDPYLQMPDISQNFNRYSYCINNPLRYTDKSGKFFLFTILNAAKDFIVNSFVKVWSQGFKAWTNSSNWHSTTMAFKIESGIFKGNFKQIASRLTWEAPQTFLGELIGNVQNTFYGVSSVSNYGGATAVEFYSDQWGAFTLGSYINGQRGLHADPSNRLFQHEYGHYLQSQSMGLFYLQRVALPSLFDAWTNKSHSYHAAEQDANIRAYKYFSKHVRDFNVCDDRGRLLSTEWNSTYNPILGYDWHYGINSDKNQKALSAGSLSLGWADYVFGPSLLIPGIIDIFQLKQ